MDLLIIFIILVVVVVIVVAILFSGHKKAIIANLSQNDPLVGSWKAVGPQELVNAVDVIANVSKSGEDYLIDIELYNKITQAKEVTKLSGIPDIDGQRYTFTAKNGGKAVLTVNGRSLTMIDANGMQFTAEKQ